MLSKTAKVLYSSIPFKKQLFSALKLFWKPDEKVFRHLHFKGVFKVKLDESHAFKLRHYAFQIENEIFLGGIRGGWEKTSIDLWIKLCKNANVVFDIGANTGVLALIAKTMNPNSLVYAIEPIKRVYEKLVANVDLNNYEIRTFEKAASNRNGSAIVFDTPTEHILSVTVNKNLNI